MIKYTLAFLLLAGTAYAQPVNSFGINVSIPNANTSNFGLVRPDNTTITITNGVISSVGGGVGSTAFNRTAYTASGAISTANTLAILNGSTALVMTLAAGTTDGQGILIKQLGTAGATVTGTIDGASQAVTLNAGTSGTIRDALKIRWSATDTSWLAE